MNAGCVASPFLLLSIRKYITGWLTLQLFFARKNKGSAVALPFGLAMYN